MGLAICKAVVEAHGGTIAFSDADGRGTRFTATFPGREASILVVDDEPAGRVVHRGSTGATSAAVKPAPGPGSWWATW